MASALKSPVPTSERGIALISALMVLVLASILGVTFIATNSSERAITSNVHVARASLLAADAGVRAAQQRLANTVRAKLDSACNVYAGSGLILTNPGSIFPSGNISYSATNPSFSTTATIAYLDTNLSVNSQTYIYRYTITSTGTAGGGNGGQRIVQSSGYLQVSADRGTFAQYLVFTNQHTSASGGTIWFTSSSQFDGRVHTNTHFSFAFKPGFTDLTTQVENKANFYNNGSTLSLAAAYNGTRDVPTFSGGFNRNSPVVTLPTNSYNQQNAALGLDPTSSSPPTNAQVNYAITSGGSSSGSTPPNGIYLINSGGAVTGGIYIQGNANQVKATCDTTAKTQTYTITQGSVTKTITINDATNTTSVYDGTSTTTYAGQPRGIVYANGAISDLRGPDRVSGQPVPAVLNNEQIMIAAKNDIVIQRDLTVEDYATGSAVVGIYSSGGNVRVGSSAPANCYLDAFVMATGGGTSGQGVFGVDNYNSGSPRGTFHLRGGMIAQYYGAFFTFDSDGVLQTGYARDFRYDKRGYIPPYFPTTNLYTRTDNPSARTLAWKEI